MVEWNADKESRALAGSAVGGNGTSVKLRNTLHQCKADSCARSMVPGLVKPVKYVREFLRRYAFAVVFHA